MARRPKRAGPAEKGAVRGTVAPVRTLPPGTALAPGLGSPRAALGRADLLRLLVAWGEGAEQAAAGLTGFEYQAAQPAKPEREQAPDSTRVQTAVPSAPASAPRPRCEQYSATLSQAADAVVASDFEQRQADIANASAPPAQPEPFAPPPMIPLSSERRLVVLAEKHLRRLHNTQEWDVAKLVEQVALGLPPKKRRAQQQRLRWRGNAMVISMGRESEPLHADYRALARLVQRRSGGQVPIYLHYLGQGWAVYQPQPRQPGQPLPRLWRDLAEAPFLAGMGGLAVGWPTFAALPWAPAAMLAACLPDDAVGAAAPVVGAARSTLGVAKARLPLACWDVGQHLHVRRQAASQLLPASDAQVARLLALLPLAVVADARLLRALRCLLGLPASTEVAVWSHADVACNGVVLTLRAARLDAYRAILQDIRLALRQQAVATIATHHGLLSFEMLLEESQRAARDVPGSARLDHGAWFASMARQMQQAVTQGAADFALTERMAYLARQGHRTSVAQWGQSVEFPLAWAWANRAALLNGKDLPTSLPLSMVPVLCNMVGGGARLPEQGVRLRQLDGFLQFEVVDAAQLQARAPADVLVQWGSSGLLKWRSTPDGNWQRAAWVWELEPIDLARYAWLELTDGQTTCIVQREARPAWALEWGRDRAGLYALLPNPWGEPVRVAYPRAAGAQVSVLVPPPVPVSAPEGKRKVAAKSAGKSAGKLATKTGFSISDLVVGLDEVGPFATLTVTGANGQHAQTLRYIAPGRFLMGSPADEPERDDNEGPQHWVSISNGFWLADTACTQGLWQAVMGENPSDFNINNGGSPMHPVEKVNWHRVQEFLQVVQSCLPGCQASLPTEAEWEYACRAGSSTPFWFGATISPEQANYDGNYPYNGGARGVYREKTVAVKEFAPNPWGLYQMSGNVWEWCRDEFRTYTADAVQDPGLESLNQPNSDSGHEVLRAVRGGSWISGAHRLRSACRDRFLPDGLYRYTGFRLALRSSRPASGF